MGPRFVVALDTGDLLRGWVEIDHHGYYGTIPLNPELTPFVFTLKIPSFKERGGAHSPKRCGAMH